MAGEMRKGVALLVVFLLLLICCILAIGQEPAMSFSGLAA
jgi:Na+-transporting methylmalonyl-CoA/oxaloacetate decarboxylase gamma subunit